MPDRAFPSIPAAANAALSAMPSSPSRPTPTSVTAACARRRSAATSHPLAGVSLEDFAWIKGRPGVFRSSEAAERGFCAQCGTPLFFRYVDKDRLALSLGSLDDPSRVVPAKQYGIEGRLPFIELIADLPGSRTEDDVPATNSPGLKSWQHPDHPD